jgi:hypothetical protein
MQVFKRIFSRTRPENVSKSIRVTNVMWDAIAQLAEEEGYSPNAFIVIVLDQFLQGAVEEGRLKLPADVEGKIKIVAS